MWNVLPPGSQLTLSEVHSDFTGFWSESVMLFRPSKYLLIWEVTGNIYNGSHSLLLFLTALWLFMKWARTNANLFCIWKKKWLHEDKVLFRETVLYFQIKKHVSRISPLNLVIIFDLPCFFFLIWKWAY